MAAPVETQGQLQDFLAILGKRKWQVILPAVLLTALGTAIAVVLPRTFKVWTEIHVYDTGIVDIRDGLANAGHQVRAFAYTKQIVEKLRWPDYLALADEDRQEYLGKMLEDLEVVVAQAEKNSSFSSVVIRYTDIDPGRGRMFLTELADSWMTRVRDKARQGVEILRARKLQSLTEAEKNVEDLTGRINELLTELGWSWFELEGNSRDGGDPVVDRLNANQATRDDSYAALASARAELGVLERKYAEMDPEVPRTITEAGSSNVEQLSILSAAIADRRAQMIRLRPENPRYQQLQREIENLEQQYAVIQKGATGATAVDVYVPNEQRAIVRAMIGQKETQIAGLEASLDRLDSRIIEDQARLQSRVLLQDNIYRLKERLDGWKQTLVDAQASLVEAESLIEVHANPQNDPFEVVRAAMPPQKPEPPSPFIIVAFGAFAGLALGLGTSLLGEFSKNSYRSVHDVTRVLAVPVLGVVNTIITRGEIRRARFRRWVVGLSSAVLIGGLAWFAWAWTTRQEILPTELRQSIEEARKSWR
jgi:uncharacterized protein involved in exopolysaccharide biosynthesis